MQGTGVLWIYGDSHNRRFYESLQGRQLCTRVFRACYHTNVWVYWLGSVNSNEMDLRSVKRSSTGPNFHTYHKIIVWHSQRRIVMIYSVRCPLAIVLLVLLIFESQNGWFKCTKAVKHSFLFLKDNKGQFIALCFDILFSCTMQIGTNRDDLSIIVILWPDVT